MPTPSSQSGKRQHLTSAGSLGHAPVTGCWPLRPLHHFVVWQVPVTCGANISDIQCDSLLSTLPNLFASLFAYKQQTLLGGRIKTETRLPCLLCTDYQWRQGRASSKVGAGQEITAWLPKACFFLVVDVCNSENIAAVASALLIRKRSTLARNRGSWCPPRPLYIGIWVDLGAARVPELKCCGCSMVWVDSIHFAAPK